MSWEVHGDVFIGGILRLRRLLRLFFFLASEWKSLLVENSAVMPVRDLDSASLTRV